MSTASKIVPSVKVLGMRETFLGFKATVAIDLGDEEVFCDEVKLWNAKSRNAFIAHCLEKVDIDDAQDFSDRIDKWLRTYNRG